MGQEGEFKPAADVVKKFTHVTTFKLSIATFVSFDQTARMFDEVNTLLDPESE